MLAIFNVTWYSIYLWQNEPAASFRALFAVDNEQLALTLNSITEIAKSSPFKDLANLNTVRAALNDPNHEWKF